MSLNKNYHSIQNKFLHTIVHCHFLFNYFKLTFCVTYKLLSKYYYVQLNLCKVKKG